MRVALLTPMKAPDHPVPSGDRTFARLIRAALGRAGHVATLPSALSTRCSAPEDLAALEDAAAGEVARIAAEWQRDGAPDAVLTYHNYHRAPDLLGPALADRFGLPYAIVEASRAPRQADGPWASGFALADRALDRAGAVGAVTARDLPALVARVGDRAVRLPPFVDTAPFVGPAATVPGRIVSVAMMRPGRKADSLRLLADAVRRIPGATVAVAGDGEARPALEPLFPPGAFVGALSPAALGAFLRTGDVFVWPALNEPFGFVFLEAQAAGLPVVAGDAPGVAAVVAEGGVRVPEGDAAALADAAAALIADRPRRDAIAAAAGRFAAANDLDEGARRLDALLARAAGR